MSIVRFAGSGGLDAVGLRKWGLGDFSGGGCCGSLAALWARRRWLAGGCDLLFLMDEEIMTAAAPKRRFRKLHRRFCGVARAEYDDYADVREACERKLGEWERAGVLMGRSFGGNDWIFGS